MISNFHLTALRKRFPRAMKEFETKYKPTWTNMNTFSDHRYYAIGLSRIEFKN